MLVTQIYYYELQSESTPRRPTLHLASYSPFEFWSLYIFHISIFFNYNFQCFLLFLGWFFLSWSLCIIVVKMTMYLSLAYGRIVLNWKTITNQYSLVSAMKKIKDLADRQTNQVQTKNFKIQVQINRGYMYLESYSCKKSPIQEIGLGRFWE